GNALHGVLGRVLARVVLLRLREADGGEPRLVERRVVPAAAEAVVARDEPHLVGGNVARGLAPDRTGELPRGRVLGPLGEDPHARGGGRGRAAGVATPDVVVEPGGRPPPRGRGLAWVGGGAHEPLLFARESGEHERGVEVDSALREDPS